MTPGPSAETTTTPAIEDFREGELTDLLERYQQAWSEHDADRIADMMSDDGVFEASYGSNPWGERFVGREVIRAGVRRNFAASPNPNTELIHYEKHMYGDSAFSMWVSSFRDAEGNLKRIHGCDYYEVRDGLVTKKIAFRKSPTPEYIVVEGPGKASA
jgi:ketosteroid isomerase-like protein